MVHVGGVFILVAVVVFSVMEGEGVIVHPLLQQLADASSPTTVVLAVARSSQNLRIQIHNTLGGRCQDKQFVSAPCLVDDLCPLDVGVVLEALLDDVLVQDIRKETRLEDIGLGRDGHAVVPSTVHYLR